MKSNNREDPPIVVNVNASSPAMDHPPVHSTDAEPDNTNSFPDQDCSTPAPANVNDGWIPATKTFSPASTFSIDPSPTPLNTFKTLRQVDEIDAKRAQADISINEEKLSNSQRKKLKKAMAAGRKSPTSHQ